MRASNLKVSGLVCALALALSASPAVAGHKHGGYYKHGHYYKHGGHGTGYGAHHRMHQRRAQPHCHAKPMGFGKWGHYGHHPMKAGYQKYNQPAASYGSNLASSYGGAKSERVYGYGAGYGSGHSDTASKATPPSAQKDIVGVAEAAENFSTLISAVKAAGLAETLTGKGPFTVLAPSDAAFSKLPEEQVSGLMRDTEALKDVLTYHVIAGELSAADLLEQGEATTVNGAKVSVAQLDVAKADIKASNGVIHVLNSVLIPTE
jgi:uncharacterized surface protein with fasciclin (FAS1) repeats